jgi:ParB-like chromosome segregation protein Spo0J
MTTLDPHPLSAFFPPISDDDFNKLAGDIKLNGLHQPIVRYQGKILDGNNRYRACELVKIAPRFTDFNGDDAQARNFVISANIHRRHLSREDRAKIIAALLKADPTQSNRQIAEQTKTSHHTVEAVREELEVGGQIAHQETTVGKDGVAQPKKRKRGGGRGKGKGEEQDSCKYPKVTNAITARKAYNIFEQHLLDTLRDVNDHSDFSQADELAQATIEKLQETLGEMQPAEEEAA